MNCPACEIAIHESWGELGPRVADEPGSAQISAMSCPSCGRALIRYQWIPGPPGGIGMLDRLRRDYGDATATLPVSAQASAALSRRIIQHVLREVGSYTARDLSKQIEAFVADIETPSQISENLDYLREIGNFAAHPMKSTHTGEVMPVEPGEADWALEMVDSLFDFYYVGPAKDRLRREEFNERLGEAGRRQLGDQ